MKTYRLFQMPAALIVGALTACGGGGGDTPTQPTSSFPVQAVYSNALSTTSSVTLSASNSTGTYQFAMTVTPQADATFEGATRKVLVETGTLKQGSTLLNTSSTFQFYSLNPPRALGGISTDGRYGVYTPIGTFPATAKAGDTWTGYVGVVYKDVTKTTKIIDLTQNWSLEPDTATTAYLCANTIQQSSSPTLTEALCRKIDTAGNVLGYRFTIAINGQTITFR